MTKKEDFDEWWDSGSLLKDNPFRAGHSMEFWAYEGYMAATQRAADIAYSELDDPFLSGHGYAENVSRAINE